MNIHSAIIEGEKILRKKFIQTSYLDSEILMAKVLNKDKKYIFLNLKKYLKKEQLNNFKRLIIERSFKKPVAHGVEIALIEVYPA